MPLRYAPRRIARFALVGLLALAVCGVASPAAAQAKLSKGLRKKLADQRVSSLSVIYTGPSSEISRLSQYYGVRVEKRLRSRASESM